MKRLYIILVTLAAIFAASCQRISEQDYVNKGKALTFTASVGGYTKAGDTYFDEGDQIGVYAMEPINRFDIRLTYNDGALEADSPVYMDPSQGGAQFYAYYPYSSGFVPTRSSYFQVRDDQNYYDGYTSSDLMAAATYAEDSSDNVHFTFHHMLSRIVLAIDNLLEEGIIEVRLKDVLSTARVNVEYDEAWIEKSNSNDISLLQAYRDGREVWMAIIPPQHVNPTIEVVTQSGKVYSFDAPYEIDFAKGYSIPGYLVLDGVSTEVTFSSDIMDWNWGDEVTFKNKSEDAPEYQAWAYVLDESGMQYEEMYLQNYENHPYSNGSYYLSVYPDGSAIIGDYNYSVYQVGPAVGIYSGIGFYSWMGWYSTSQAYTLDEEESVFIYRSPAAWCFVGDPENPYEGLDNLPTIRTSLTDLVNIGIPNPYQKYILTGTVAISEAATTASFYLIEDNASLYVPYIEGVDNLEELSGKMIQICAAYVQTADAGPMLCDAEFLGIVSDEDHVWTVIGTIGGTNWDTDFPMDYMSIANVDGTIDNFYVAYVKYQAGQEFKVRADYAWDLDYGAYSETGGGVTDTVVLDFEEGYAGCEAARGGHNIAVDVASYPDFCGMLAIIFNPSEGIIAAADYDVFQEKLQGGFDDPSEEPDGLSVTEVIRLEDNTEVEIEETVVVAKYARGFVIFDGENGLLVYQGSKPEVEVNLGDVVKVEGVKQTYNNAAQISNQGLKVEVLFNVADTEDWLEEFDSLDEAFAMLYGEMAEEISYSLDNWSYPAARPVKVVGVLTSSTSIACEGQNRTVGIEYPLDDMSALLAQNVNRECDAKGFAVNYNNTKVTLVIYSIEFGDEVEPDEIIDVTIPEFLQAPESSTQRYRLVGQIATHDGTINTQYGNFDLVDSAGNSVYVYGLTSTPVGYGGKNDRTFGRLGLEEGDVIKLVGYRGSYSGTIEVMNAYFEEKLPAGTAY